MGSLKRGFIIPTLFIIAALLLVGGVIYTYNQNKSQISSTIIDTSPQETSTAQTSASQKENWKTYLNSTYGFELQYPNYYDSFKEANLANNQKGIYIRETANGGYVEYKTKVAALVSEQTASQQANIGELRINVYDLDSYGISDIPGAREFGFDSSKNQWWQDSIEGNTITRSVSELPEIGVGNNLIGYKIGIGDAGGGFEYVLIPVVTKKVMIEVLFYRGIGATQDVPIETILSTFRLI